MAKSKILIVEDENIVALDIKRNLISEGYSVCGIIASGEAALDSFEELQPDLVLMDIKLQGRMDGIETAEQLRKKYHIPVVFLTAFADDETIERVKITEPFGYIIKPFTERELRTTIEMALYKYSIDLELIKSEEKYRRFFKEDLSGNVIFSPAGEILNCNKAFLLLSDFPDTNTVLGNNFYEMIQDPQQRKWIDRELSAKGKVELFELSLKSNENKEKSVLATFITIFEGDEIREIKGHLIDITKRKTLEEQLRQSQKMEAVGRLAGGIAHDFNNILTIIMGYSTMIYEKLKEGSDIDTDLSGIQNAAKKASNLTRQLLAFSRRQELEPELVNINELIKDIEKMVRRLLTEDIGMQLFLEAEDAYVYVDPSQMEQVIMNLAINSRDAMPHGGKLIIKTEKTNEIDSIFHNKKNIPEGEYVVLSVIDSGTGIEDEIKAKIFEPFFTTKTEQEGTGLGLSTVYGIVEQSGGYIQVDSEKGKGSQFKLFFPMQRVEIPEEESKEFITNHAMGTETILLVEDEKNVMELIGKVLLRNGYNVLEASNAGEAILIFEQHGDTIDLLISDLVMPYLSGDKLAERLKSKSPGLKTLLMSGYPSSIIRERGFTIDMEYFIHKPFEPSVLLEKVRSVLNRN